MTENKSVIEAQVLFRPASVALRFLPEGPYPYSDNKFSWVAIQHGKEARSGSLNIYDATLGVNHSFELPGRPGFAFPTDEPDVFVIGCERSLGLFNTLTKVWFPIAEGIDRDRTNTIINDGVVFRDNLIFGCKDLEFKTKKAGLYLYRGSDQKLIRLRDDQICSNGKVVVPAEDGSITLYDIDSPTRKIVAYTVDIAAGTISDATTVIDLTSEAAVPDGMISTPDGKSLIVAMFNPEPVTDGETRQYSLLDGKIEKRWRTACSPQNTCPQLVRLNGVVTLVVTTAVEHMPAKVQERATNAGCIFAAKTDWDRISDSPEFKLPMPLRELLR